MSYQKFFLFIFTSAILFQNCSTTKYHPENFPEYLLTFGEGGGFKGMQREYVLLENGQIFKKTKPEEFYTELEPIPASEAKDFYAQLGVLRLQNLNIEKPGNLYYFIRCTTKELDYRITWGAADYNLRQDIMNFYKSLNELVKNRKTLQRKEGKGVAEIKHEEKKKKDPAGW